MCHFSGLYDKKMEYVSNQVKMQLWIVEYYRLLQTATKKTFLQKYEKYFCENTGKKNILEVF